MNNPENGKLTPAQSSDVIRYFHNGDNEASRRNGGKDKIPLARSALRAASSKQSILPSEKPLLTIQETAEGLEHSKALSERQNLLKNYLSTPPRTNDDRDWAERAAGEDLDAE